VVIVGYNPTEKAKRGVFMYEEHANLLCLIEFARHRYALEVANLLIKHLPAPEMFLELLGLLSEAEMMQYEHRFSLAEKKEH